MRIKIILLTETKVILNVLVHNLHESYCKLDLNKFHIPVDGYYDTDSEKSDVF